MFAGLLGAERAAPLGVVSYMERHMPNPATRRRGGDPDIKPKPSSEKQDDPLERALEEGLEESMAGSDPVSITQPPKSKIEQPVRRKKAAGQ
jgi:hypothetical protein